MRTVHESTIIRYYYNAAIQDFRGEMSVSGPIETPPTDVTLFDSFSSLIVSFAGPNSF